MRLIDADAFKFRACTEYDCKDKPCEDCLDQYITKREIDNAPTVERPQGEWITRTKDNGVNYHFYCSCCDREVIQITDYCPNCGARMTKEVEND